MLFSVGTKVRFVHTGDEGVITQILSNTMVQVLIDNAFEIPAAIENLRRADQIEKRQQKATPKREKRTDSTPIVKHQPSRKRVRHRRLVPPKKVSITNTGVHLVFEPSRRSDGTTAYFNIQLVNDTSYSIVYDFAFKLMHQQQHKVNDKIDSGAIESLYHFAYDDLNNSPSVDIELLQLTTAGLGEKLQKTIKIKAKQFFKKIGLIPIKDTEGHIYTLLHKFSTKEATAPKEDLKTYTKMHQKEKKQTVLKDNLYTLHKIHDKAAFAEELDLHIEEMTDDHKKLSNGEKLRLQLKVFEEYLDQAIRLGVPKVYIIHGLGKGRLKNEVAQRLITNPYVKSFKNEHHHKYGFGATEVILD